MARRHTHTHTPIDTKKTTIQARSVIDDGRRVLFNEEIPRRRLRTFRIRKLNARGAKQRLGVSKNVSAGKMAADKCGCAFPFPPANVVPSLSFREMMPSRIMAVAFARPATRREWFARKRKNTVFANVDARYLPHFSQFRVPPSLSATMRLDLSARRMTMAGTRSLDVAASGRERRTRLQCRWQWGKSKEIRSRVERTAASSLPYGGCQQSPRQSHDATFRRLGTETHERRHETRGQRSGEVRNEETGPSPDGARVLEIRCVAPVSYLLGQLEYSWYNLYNLVLTKVIVFLSLDGSAISNRCSKWNKSFSLII